MGQVEPLIALTSQAQLHDPGATTMSTLPRTRWPYRSAVNVNRLHIADPFGWAMSLLTFDLESGLRVASSYKVEAGQPNDNPYAGSTRHGLRDAARSQEPQIH